MIRSALALVALLLALSACGTRGAEGPGDGPVDVAGPVDRSPSATRTAGPEMTGTDLRSPGPFRLLYDDRELVLRPHTWCYENGCVDGYSPDPPSIGNPGVVRVVVPVEDWDLSATFTPVGQKCGRQQTVEPPRTADGTYLLEPAGGSGSYDVVLFAQGDGDVVAHFRWDTPADGELPTPTARLALIADHDGEPDSYGVELMLENLAETPRSATAAVTATAANGRSLTFEARRASHCWPEGTLYFDGPDTQGRAAAALGDFPFRYEVTVTMAGTTYRAVADYPADEIRGNEPSVALEFTPDLPALG